MSELIDNRAQRVRTLKGIIKRLHAGEAPDEVRASLKELVCQTDYSEVMAMEQELIAAGSSRSSRRHVSPGERGPPPVHRAPATGDQCGPRNRGRRGRGGPAARM